MTDLFPPEDFDSWAENYDQSVSNTQDFPFAGYESVLDKIVELSNPMSGLFVLDLGIGTGNLALRFDNLGCEIWGTDFSARMLEKTKLKLTRATLLKYDLREPWPPEMNRRYDRIVSAYVFHHFQLAEKIEIIQKLIVDLLEPGGKLILGDIAFQNQSALEIVKHAVGDEWEDEFYWLADETIPAFAEAGLHVKYHWISSCAGVFEILSIRTSGTAKVPEFF